jgi:hypothetical protein
VCGQVRIDEAESGPPGALVVAANRQMDGDELIVQAEGRKFVDDGIPGSNRAKPVRLSRHRGVSEWEL